MSSSNKIELASDSKCCGLCASKEVVIEGLFITTTEKSCMETVQNVIPLAAVDDITLINPTSCAYCIKCVRCGCTVRNGKIICCDCSCSDAVLTVSYGGKMVSVEKIEEPEMVFEQLKQRLHFAKGGPARNKMN